MLTVGGGDGVTVDPKRGTREGFGAGLGFTARLWLRQWDWNAGATGGGAAAADTTKGSEDGRDITQTDVQPIACATTKLMASESHQEVRYRE